MTAWETLTILAQQAPPEAGYGLSLGGWILMVLSVGFMTGLLAWCIYKVVSTPGSTQRVHSQADIEPPDQEE